MILLRANRLDVFRGHSIPNAFVFLLILSNRGWIERERIEGIQSFFQAESDSATLDGGVERAFSATPPRQSLIKAEYPAEHLHLHLGSAGADSPAFSSLFAAGTFNASLIAARRRWNGFYTGERPRFEYNRFQGGSINRGRAAFQSGTRENKFSRGVVGYCPTPRDAYSKSADTFYLLPSLSSN